MPRYELLLDCYSDEALRGMHRDAVKLVGIAEREVAKAWRCLERRRQCEAEIAHEIDARAERAVHEGQGDHAQL